MNRKLDNGTSWQEIEQFFNQLSLVTRLGIEVSFANPQQPKCAVNDIQPYHLGGIGQDYINGVIISGIIDLALGLTALTESKMGEFATTSLSINLAKPISNGRFMLFHKASKK
jgi:acyl-coenzyme A thioesterase PaaI-like protein